MQLRVRVNIETFRRKLVFLLLEKTQQFSVKSLKNFKIVHTFMQHFLTERIKSSLNFYRKKNLAVKESLKKKSK